MHSQMTFRIGFHGFKKSSLSYAYTEFDRVYVAWYIYYRTIPLCFSIANYYYKFVESNYSSQLNLTTGKKIQSLQCRSRIYN